MKLYCVDGPCGSGKTFHAIDDAVMWQRDEHDRHVSQPRQGYKCLIAQPTKELVDRSFESFKQRHPKANGTKIHADCCDNVDHELSEQTKQPDDDQGSLIFCTHTGLLQAKYIHNKEDWHVVFDEVPSPIWDGELDLKYKRHRDELLSAINAYPIKDGYQEIVCKDSEILNSIAQDAHDNWYSEKLKDVARKLASGFWHVYVLPEQWQKLMSGEKTKLLLFGLLDLAIFDGFADVTFLSANFDRTLLGLYLISKPIAAIKHRRISNKLRNTKHTNGHLLKIYYSTVADWSKRQRDTRLNCNGKDIDYNQLIANDAMTLLGNDKFVKLMNKDAVKNDPFGDKGEMLPFVSHGLNTFQHFHNACIIPAFRPTPPFLHFLRVIAKLDPDKVHRAIYCEQIYQAITRISLRNPLDMTPKRVIVADLKAANFLTKMFPGSTVEILPHADEVIMPEKKPHGNTNQETPVDKEIRKKQLQTEANRRYRWRQRNSRVMDKSVLPNTQIPITPPSIPRMPPSVQEKIPDNGFMISFWDSRATGFRPYDFHEPHYYRNFIGQQVKRADELRAVLQQKATLSCESKKHVNLICPAAFDLTQDADHGHSKTNYAYGQGIMLDIENTDLTPENFHQALPYEMLVYSSWSHDPDKDSKNGWRYRICIPTTPMSYDAHHAINLMCLQKVKDWIAQSNTPTRRHGIDDSKMTPVSLFYLPSNRANGFIKQFDGPAINPIEWIANCPSDIIDKVIEKSPHTPEEDMTSVEQPITTPSPETASPASQPYSTEHTINWAIRVFRERGCAKGPGNKYFWWLGKALAERTTLTNCEIEQILREQSIYANNPTERQSEIAGILKRMRR